MEMPWTVTSETGTAAVGQELYMHSSCFSLPYPTEHFASLSQTSQILVGPAISKDNRYQRAVSKSFKNKRFALRRCIADELQEKLKMLVSRELSASTTPAPLSLAINTYLDSSEQFPNKEQS